MLAWKFTDRSVKDASVEERSPYSVAEAAVTCRTHTGTTAVEQGLMDTLVPRQVPVLAVIRGKEHARVRVGRGYMKGFAASR